MLSHAILFAGCAASAIAQSTTALPATSGNTMATATVLIGTLTTGLAASVVSASACGDTTYVFECTDTLACSDLPPFSATEGPTHFMFSYTSSTGGAAAGVTQSCSLSGSSYAVCANTFSLSVDGTSSVTSATTTASGSQLQFAQVPITAGANMLATATGSCKTSGSAAAPTDVMEVYKVLVVPAAAALVAAGALM
ncbi:hypothetical protein LTR12_015401 [Friedmanniomyces endolithicus]|nr:hypothetical protein LTR74_015841 [Friedmanniomyces endolithicus]KAK1810252.1 hypothetical protein LTR12_015401 [Friedmanniomyces endolithicus]